MLLAFIITVYMSSGQKYTVIKQAKTENYRPIKNISTCYNYAEKMQERLNIAIKHDNYIDKVTVQCDRLPHNKVIKPHSPNESKKKNR